MSSASVSLGLLRCWIGEIQPLLSSQSPPFSVESWADLSIYQSLSLIPKDIVFNISEIPEHWGWLR